MRPELAALGGFIAGLFSAWLLFKLFGPFRVGGTVTITSATCNGQQVHVVGTVALNAGSTLLEIDAFVFDDPSTTAGDTPPTGFQSFGPSNNFAIDVNVPSTNTGADCVGVWAKISGFSAPATSGAVGPCTTSSSTTSTTTTTTTSTTSTTSARMPHSKASNQPDERPA